jgi:hypothetical protein
LWHQRLQVQVLLSTLLEGILFFKKNKVKKKIFKKNTSLIKGIKINKTRVLRLFYLMYLYKKYYTTNTIKNHKELQIKYLIKDTLVVCISQKIFNNKSTIIVKKNLHTFSIGSILKYFKIKQGKYVRRSLKGLKIFLNFLVSFLKKNFFLKKRNLNNFIFHINGFDYNFFYLKKNLKKFFINKHNFFFILNLKISFTKTKDKKIKAIKKRLKKKILLNFIKTNKIKK